jgi:hypothetical protein
MQPRVSAQSLALLAATSSLLVGCEAVKVVFKAGVWVGVIGFVLLLMLVLGLVRMVKGS